MNCQDLREILDNRNLARVDAAERREVEAHLAACPECAREWELFKEFVALPDMVESPGFVARCRAAVAAAGGIEVRRRIGVRSVLIGSLLAVAAAAAIYVGREQGQVIVAKVVAHHGEAVAAMQPPPEAAPPAVVSGAPSPSIPTERTSESAASALPASEIFTLGVVPMEIGATDDFGKSALDAFHAATLDELRAIPGLKLESTVSVEAAKLAGLDYVMVTEGGRKAQGSTLRVLVRVARNGPNGVVQPFSGEFTPDCVNGSDSAVGACMDARSLAAFIVNLARTRLFPTDRAVRQKLEARLADPTLDPASREEALRELSLTRARPSDAYSADVGARNALSATGVARSAISLAAVGSSSQRAMVWRTMRGAGNPELIDPLVAAARFDPDRVVRQEAVATLAADFAGNSRTKEALDAVMREEQSPMIRALAARVVDGEEGWQQYVSASLKDRERPVEERIEPLLHHLKFETGWPLEDEDFAALGNLLLQALEADLGEQATGLIVSRMGGVNHPTTTDALLVGVESSKHWPVRRIILNQLARRNADSRVQAVLQKIAASDPDADAREAARAALTPRSDTP